NCLISAESEVDAGSERVALVAILELDETEAVIRAGSGELIGEVRGGRFDAVDGASHRTRGIDHERDGGLGGGGGPRVAAELLGDERRSRRPRVVCVPDRVVLVIQGIAARLTDGVFRSAPVSKLVAKARKVAGGPSSEEAVRAGSVGTLVRRFRFMGVEAR